MSNDERDRRFWIRTWWPVTAMAALIAMSSSTAFGANDTTGPLRWLWQAVFGPVSNAEWGIVHLLIRKSGHFAGYGVLGLAWLRAWWLTFPRARFIASAALALLGTACIASCDELHQAFLANRTGSPWDVLLDCTGAIVLQMLVYGIVRLSRPEWLARTA